MKLRRANGRWEAFGEVRNNWDTINKARIRVHPITVVARAGIKRAKEVEVWRNGHGRDVRSSKT